MKHQANLTEQIVLRVPPSLRDRIERAAAQEDRSVANLLRRILERSFAGHNSSTSEAA